MNFSIEKFFKTLSNMSEKNQYYVFWAVLGFLLLINYFFITSPQLSRLSFLGPTSKKFSEDYQEAKRNIKKFTQYRVEVVWLKEQLDFINQSIKSREEVPLILETISRLASKSGIKIDQIMPNTQAEETILIDDDIRYNSLPIFIQAKGGYHQLGRFINAIETESLTLDVAGFSITSGQEDALTQPIQLTIKTIIFEKSKETPQLKKKQLKSSKKATKKKK